MDKTNKNFWKAWMLVLSVFISLPLRAAPDSGYQVEIIVFERDTRGATATHEGSGRITRGATATHEGSGRITAPPDYSNALTPGSDGISVLAPARFQLTGLEQKLKRSGRTPLVHTGWVQKRRESRAVRITSNAIGAGDTAPIVDGAARLKVGELLNVGIDLTCRDGGDVTSIIETRTVKFGELHYFDGDQFGVLMQVTRATGGE